MRYVPRAILVGGLGLAAAFLVACGGGSSLLSSNQANSLLAAFDRVGTAAQSGNCATIDNANSQLDSQIQNLPGSIQGNITDSLNQWASTVGSLATKACKTTTTSTTTSTPSTTSSTTSSTTTTSTTTTTTPPPPTSTSTTTTSATTTTGGSTTTGSSGGAGLGGGGGSGGGAAGTGP